MAHGLENQRRQEQPASGLLPDLDERLEAGRRSGLLRHLHAVLVVRNGGSIFERYFEGPDENWGAQLGHVAFGPDTLHDLRSVTKSIVSLLYGIALEHGLVPAPAAPLLAQFPDYQDLAEQPQRRRMTVRHALTMTLGTEWDEDRPYTDPENSELAMEHAQDRYRYILERPSFEEPGSSWTYSGGAVALLGALIARGTGMSLPEFASQALFEPLGIDNFEWAQGRDGTPSAASGLRLRPRDLLRIGTMIVDGGVFQGRRIVAKAWLDASFAPSTQTPDGLDYGYLWFLGAAPVAEPKKQLKWMGGFGNGGQRLWLMPDVGLSAVIMSGNYNAPDAWVTPTRVWREIVIPSLSEMPG